MSFDNAASTRAAIYQPLTSEREIRLLELLPGSAHDVLECVLENGTLGSREFEAISYTWGGAEKQMTCNSQRLTISESLHDALLQLRSPSESRWLWADQICINQANQYEKDVLQIPIVYLIYSEASQVIIWLGKSQDDSDLAMDTFYQMVQDLLDPSSPSSQERIRELDQRHGRGATAINHLLQRPWFSRAWTLQEVAVAKRASLLCGSKHFDWKWVALFNEKIQTESDRRWTSMLATIDGATYRTTAETGRHSMGNIHAIWKLKTGVVSPVTDTRYLHRVRSCGVTRPRDKILSLLHFVSTDLQSYLQSVENGVSYSTAEFYQAVASFELGQCSNIDFLCAAGLVQRSEALKTMPSWVADWTTRETTHDLWLLNRLKLEISKHGLWQASKQDVTITIRGSLLHTKGYILDAVLRVSDPPTFNIINDFVKLKPDDHDGLKKWMVIGHSQRKKYIIDCAQIADSQQCKDFYGESLLSAFQQTMMRGIIQDGDGMTSGGTQRRATDTELKGLFQDFFVNMAIQEDPRFLTEWRGLSNIPSYKGFTTVLLHVQDSFKGRVLFTTRKGRMGLGPHALDSVQKGDHIVLVSGCCTPFIARPVLGSNQNEYELVGEAYVHGLMDGEAEDLGEGDGPVPIIVH